MVWERGVRRRGSRRVVLATEAKVTGGGGGPGDWAWRG